MEGQRAKARAGSSFDSKKGDGFTFMSDEEREALRAVGDTFDGYTETELKGVPVLALFERSEDLGDVARSGRDRLRRRSARRRSTSKPAARFRIRAGWRPAIGGQRSRVTGVSRLGPGLPRAHRVENIEGRLALRDIVATHVDTDAARRHAPQSHGHAPAARGAAQGARRRTSSRPGSLVAPDRLRFDFHALLRRDAGAVGRGRAARQRRDREERHRSTPRSATRRKRSPSGAMALFGEKYGDKVRVVSIGDGSFSTELCGGTHVRATGDIGSLLITEESGVAAGVRRIEAVTGLGAYEFARQCAPTKLAACAATMRRPALLERGSMQQGKALSKPSEGESAAQDQARAWRRRRRQPTMTRSRLASRR